MEYSRCFAIAIQRIHILEGLELVAYGDVLREAHAPSTMFRLDVSLTVVNVICTS